MWSNVYHLGLEYVWIFETLVKIVTGVVIL